MCELHLLHFRFQERGWICTTTKTTMFQNFTTLEKGLILILILILNSRVQPSLRYVSAFKLQRLIFDRQIPAHLREYLNDSGSFW